MAGRASGTVFLRVRIVESRSVLVVPCLQNVGWAIFVFVVNRILERSDSG